MFTIPCKDYIGQTLLCQTGCSSVVRVPVDFRVINIVKRTTKKAL